MDVGEINSCKYPGKGTCIQRPFVTNALVPIHQKDIIYVRRKCEEFVSVKGRYVKDVSQFLYTAFLLYTPFLPWIFFLVT